MPQGCSCDTYVLTFLVSAFFTEPYCDSCTNADVTADVYYSGSSSDQLESAVLEAFTDRCDEMKDIKGVVDTFDPCPTIQVSQITGSAGSGSDGNGSGGDGTGGDGTGGETVAPTQPPDGATGGNATGGNATSGNATGGNATAGVTPDGGDNGDKEIAPVVASAESQNSGLSGGGAFGVAMAALVLVALLALLLRRRRRNRNGDLAKHEQIQDVGDDTFMIESPEKSRYTDDDSAFGSRYGMYPEGKSESMLLGAKSMNQDVHKCSSATCTLCESRRQAGLMFLPAKGPARRVPAPDLSDSMREYESEDTVNL
jgi:MYXO-CTERM domain-containing protein